VRVVDMLGINNRTRFPEYTIDDVLYTN